MFYRAVMQFDLYDKKFIHWLNTEWNIEFRCIRRDMNICGSPERTFSRAVIQNRYGTLFLVEQFSKKKFFILTNIAKLLEYLISNGLNRVATYKKT